jgi:polysaccharide biosynthesis/export protein
MFEKNRYSLFYSILIILVISGTSCISQKKIAYFQNLEPVAKSQLNSEEIQEKSISRIYAFDFIYVDIRTMDEKTEEFIRGNANMNMGLQATSPGMIGYRVDKNGFVNLPLIGKVHVLGLTLEEAEKSIKEELKTYLKEPYYVKIVNLTFVVHFFDENGRAQQLHLSRESSTLIDALSLAGGMSDFGKRENLRVVRNYPADPKLFMLDMRDIASMQNEGFYLQTNDMIFVEPFQRKNFITNVSTFNIFISLFNTALVIYALIASSN